ncbi:unnamed protein product, partial [marine sediment metagenome]
FNTKEGPLSLALTSPENITYNTTSDKIGKIDPKVVSISNKEEIKKRSVVAITVMPLNLESYWYSIDSGVTNISFDLGDDVYWNNGHITLDVWGNDSDNVIATDKVEFTMDVEQYTVQDTTGTTWVRVDNTSIDVTKTKQKGIVEVAVGLNNTNNYSATFFFDFKSSNITIANLSFNTSSSLGKSFVHNSTPIPGLLNKSLLVPNTGAKKVYICPGATSFETVNDTCKGKVNLKFNQTVSGMTMTNAYINGNLYYKIINITGTGGGEGAAPTLTNGNVTPIVGVAATDFYYNVTYTDAENDTATSVLVMVNGTSNYTLTEFNSS